MEDGEISVVVNGVLNNVLVRRINRFKEMKSALQQQAEYFTLKARYVLKKSINMGRSNQEKGPSGMTKLTDGSLKMIRGGKDGNLSMPVILILSLVPHVICN
jgi:hypothetical protein